MTGIRGMVALVLVGAFAGASAVAALAGDGAGEAPAEFAEAYLNDPANIEAGKAVWDEQCRGCHGRAAYPGKAPKLKPRRYTPEFVYDRVTNGFRKMPAWEKVYSQKERRAVVAFILSDQFSP